MSLNIPQSYEDEFCDIIKKLYKKYPEDIFKIEGIHPDQMDINKSAREFFRHRDDDSTTADHSIDGTSNISNNSMITFFHEVPKPLMKLNSIHNIWKMIVDDYSLEEANKILEMEIAGDIYINDAFDTSRPYCYNYSTMDLAKKGLPVSGRLNIVPPKSLTSFLHQVEQFVVTAANLTLGATGLADILIVASLYIDKILETGKDHHITIAFGDNKKEREELVWVYVREALAHLIYTLNFEFRGNQCVTEDTEVLTPSGFKNYKTLKDGDEIYTWKHKEININNVQKVNVYDYNGEMHKYVGNDFCQVVTPNHRVLYKTDSKDYSLSDSSEIFNLKSSMYIPVIRKDIQKDYKVCDSDISDSEVIKKEIIQYNGKVWCPTTEDGIVIFRKDGKLFISGNSPFTNISIYDDNFIMQLAPNYELDGKTPSIETIKKVQDIFIDVMNSELERNPITFPVTTACISVSNKDGKRVPQDIKFIQHISNKNLKNAFMNIYVGETSTLSSCCRLRSSISDLGYTNTFGSGSTKIGSLGVVTVNLPRLAKKSLDNKEDFNEFLKRIKEITRVVGIINNSKRKILLDKIERGALPLYNLGFMDINTQYSTVGFNGLYEAMKLLGYDMRDNKGIKHAIATLDAINDENDILSKEFGAPHNMEQVPAESSAVKLVKKDRILGIFKDMPDWNVPIYSNQFLPLWEDGIDLLDRIEAQGKLDQKCTGGAVCHLNVDQQIKRPETMEHLILHAVEQGVIYFAINYQINKCENNHMSVGKDVEICPICSKPITDKYTRIVGFLTNLSSWSQERKKYDYPNRKFYDRVSSEMKKLDKDDLENEKKPSTMGVAV